MKRLWLAEARTAIEIVENIRTSQKITGNKDYPLGFIKMNFKQYLKLKNNLLRKVFKLKFSAV